MITQEEWISDSIRFSSAHLYELKNWTAEKNAKAFGACFSTYGHGHNYLLETRVPKKMVAGPRLREALKSIFNLFDHQHLSFVLEEFKTKEKVPTTENLVLMIVQRMAQHLEIDPHQLHVRLWETDQLAVTFGDWD